MPVMRFPPVRVLCVILSIVVNGVVPPRAAAQGGREVATAVYRDPFDQARGYIRQTMETEGIPSVSVAVARAGKILWEQSFGWANRENMVAATPDTMYSLASISKPFTATGVMRLVEDGKIDLDKPVNEYLGASKLLGLAGDVSGATVRRVLSHTSGLPLYHQFFYENGGYDPSDMEETITRYGVLVNPPGKFYEYSNLGFGILGHIAARVSGLDYEDYMRVQVFLPLGLTHTSVGIGPGLKSYSAERYDSKQRQIPFYSFDHLGASAIYSSAHDLVRFGMFHLKDHLSDQHSILNDATIDSMQQTATPRDVDGESYGLGWATGNQYGYRSISHAGTMPGVRTVINLYPSENLAIVVLTNSENNATSKIAERVAAAVLPKYAAALQADKPKPASRPPAFAPPPELLGEWAGTLRTWQRSIPFTLVLQADGDIHVRLGDELETLLNEVEFENGHLVGRFAGAIPTPDAVRHRHTVLLNVRFRNGEISGEASAQAIGELDYFALTSYVSLAHKSK
jgi:CubicO group peptidase (beta-lactamase class C family)